MNKIAWPSLARHLIGFVLGYFAARNVAAKEVVDKLMAGDTVQLWGGAWSFNLQQIVDVVTNSWGYVLAMIVPVGLSLRTKLQDKYAILVARLSPKVLTKEEVELKVTKASTVEKIKSVDAEKTIYNP